MKTSFYTYALTLCAAGSLLTLTSCNWVSKTSDDAQTDSSVSVNSSEVLLTIDGKPALTIPEFEFYYEQLLEQQPQLKSFAAFMPDLKMNIYSTLVGQKVLEHWVKKEQINDKPEYQTDRKMLIENVDRGLAIKYFQERHPVSITDADVKQYYDKNKDTVYIMSPAGVNASGVTFDSEDAAKAFLAKAQMQPATDLTKIAAEINVAVRPLGRVNEESQIDKTLKDKIMALKTFPTVQMFKIDKTYWVVQAKSKDQAKYYPFEQAKEDARNRLEQEHMGEMFNTEIEKLKKDFDIVEHKEYFEAKKEEAKPEQETAVAAAPVKQTAKAA